MRGRFAGYGRVLLEDHDEFLLQRGGVGHGEVDAVRSALAELEGRVLSDDRVAKGESFSLRTGHYDDRFLALGDLPAGGDAGGGALIGGGVWLELGDGSCGGFSCRSGRFGLATGGDGDGDK